MTKPDGRPKPALEKLARNERRKGEVLALRWAELDSARCTLRIAGSVEVVDGKPQVVVPKTAASVRTLRRAGLPEATRFHDLRHSCATLLIQQGIHLGVVMEILGHSSKE